MNDDIAIKVEHLSKAFKLPHEKVTSIKGALINFARRKKGYEMQRVLNNISFEVKKGEFFGIVGRNGSGKSTLLKLLAGIYTSTEGSVTINGKLTPFIELGVGFNPELTGRENVFLNGALLGFNRKEMQAMYNDIVAFAELERFMDQKLKNYSSGMQVRLAFSIAIRARSDVLVLDEVLAVGDEAFQQKCIDIFESYKRNKQTIILVTHDMEIVRRFCTRAILIQNGSLTLSGQPAKVANAYSELNLENTVKDLTTSNTNTKASVIHLEIQNQRGSNAPHFRTSDKLRVRVSWTGLTKKVENVGVAIIKNSGEYMFGTNTIGLNLDLTDYCIDLSIDLNLGSGKYRLVAGLFGPTDRDVVAFLDDGPQIIITDDHNNRVAGMTRLPYKWVATNEE